MHRKVLFELHIKPLFRAIDRDHMLWHFDLWNPDSFYERNGQPKMHVINAILDHLTSNGPDQMPPNNNAGPWPEEWIDLYRRWIDEGCGRLSLTKGDYQIRKDGSTVKLFAKIEIDQGAECWWERQYEGSDSYIYHLSVESKEETGQSEGRIIREFIGNFPSQLQKITIVDQDGIQELPIPIS
ncbi:hypothetical protein [Reichenbachiella sp.]|uniref:hypothetical protein n=1 Tax=Reichenbachiella sp. TaxID=2184521 RepID=UPI003BAEDC27